MKKEDIHMYTEKDILTRLQNGESADAIANEMAAILNQASKTYAEEAAKQNDVQKKKELAAIMEDFTKWFNKYYDVPEVKVEKVEVDQVIELMDSLVDYTKTLKDLAAVFVKSDKKPAKTIIKAKTPDQTISDFLTEMGW